jgi:hypothetical protein
MRKICETRMNEMKGEKRRFRNLELDRFCSSSHVIRMIKSVSMKQRSCSTLGGDGKCIQNFDWKA